MAYDSRTYRVLIASPADVSDERLHAVAVIQDWNNLHSRDRHVVLLPLRWETHTAPAYNVRPQEVINRMIVDDCDLVVGIFWTKLGTPTGEADSGTLEEIERAAKAGKPVMLYFSHAPIDPYKTNPEQTERLRAFRERVFKHALVEVYISTSDFRDKFSRHLEMKIRELQQRDSAGEAPLALQVLSLDTGEPIGDRVNLTVEALHVLHDDVQVDTKLKAYLDKVVEVACLESAVLPVPLAIKNNGSSGIRNVYVEMSIKTVTGKVQVWDSHPLAAIHPPALTWSSMFTIYNTPVREVSEAERKVARLRSEGLVRDLDGCKFSFACAAIQPQRLHLIQPCLYFYVAAPSVVQFAAKVYAESFAQPITLHATIDFGVQDKPVKAEGLVAKAKKLQEAETTLVMPVGATTGYLNLGSNQHASEEDEADRH